MGCVEDDEGRSNALRVDQNTRFFINDRLGSAALVLAGDGRVVARNAYRPWGGTWHTWLAEDERAPRYRFTGKPDDVAAGVVSIGVRNYLPALGRWTSPDPRYLFEAPGAAADPSSDRGLFRYAMNKPIDLADPDGRDVHEYGISAGIELMGMSLTVSVGYVQDSDGSYGVAFTAAPGGATTPLGGSIGHYYQRTLHQDIDSAQADSTVEHSVSGGEIFTAGHTKISGTDSSGQEAGYVGSRTQIGVGVGMTPVTGIKAHPVTKYYKLKTVEPVKQRRGDLGVVGNIYRAAVRPLMELVGS